MSLETKKADDVSAVSIPIPDVKIKIVSDIVVSADTTGSNNVTEYGKQVIVRGATQQELRIPINIEREISRYENLVANRGRKEPTTTSTED
jgi:hypothetical protein